MLKGVTANMSSHCNDVHTSNTCHFPSKMVVWLPPVKKIDSQFLYFVLCGCSSTLDKLVDFKRFSLFLFCWGRIEKICLLKKGQIFSRQNKKKFYAATFYKQLLVPRIQQLPQYYSNRMTYERKTKNWSILHYGLQDSSLFLTKKAQTSLLSYKD